MSLSGTILINNDGGPTGLVNCSGSGSAGGVAGAPTGTAPSAVSPVAVAIGLATLVESAASPVAIAMGLATLVGALVSVLHRSALIPSSYRMLHRCGSLEAMVKSEYVRA